MAKYLTKRSDNQSKQSDSIHLHIKVKRTNNLQHNPSWKTKATKVNAIMKKLDDSDGNGHEWKTNINYFAKLFKKDNDEGTNNRAKPKTPIIVPNEHE